MSRRITLVAAVWMIGGCSDGTETGSSSSSSSASGASSSGGGGATSSSSSGSSGGAGDCFLDPPTGACSAGDTCGFSDGGCNFEYDCKEGLWASLRSCGTTCAAEPPTAGDACDDEGGECLYSEAGACTADLKCTAGAWVDNGC